MEAGRNTMAEPSRIMVARLTRGFSRPKLASEINCSPSLLSNIELGNRSAEDHIEPIGRSLRFPVAFFYSDPIAPISANSFSYRRKCSMKVCDQTRLEATSTVFAKDLTDLLRTYIRFPEASVPDLSGLVDRGPAFQCGESVAAAIRARFNMGDAPLRHAIDLAESMGILVFWASGPQEFDAVSFWVDGQPFIVANWNKMDGYRMRFSILHEIFHLVAHRNILECTKEHDRQADAFASAMLMPLGTFARNAPRRFDPYVFLEHRRIWGASVASIVRRCRDIGAISDWSYRDANIKMQKMGWRMNEPKPAQVEESSTHKFFFEEAADRGRFAFELADEKQIPYDLFVEAFPTAYRYERAANRMNRYSTA